MACTDELYVQVIGRGSVISDPEGIDCRADDAPERARRDSSACWADFDAGSTITLTAEPDPGQQFTGWSAPVKGRAPGRALPPLPCSDTAPTCTFTINTGVGVRATFAPAPPSPYLLRVSTAGAGAGSVTTSPGGDCSTLCWYPFDRGSSVTLTAVPAAGSTFAGFTGAPCSSNPCTIAMTESRYVTAKFDLSPTDAPDTTAPDTRITFTPTNPSNDHSWFRFTATETGATFQCSLDGAPGVGCTSPVDYPCLAPGRHTFRVWATDLAGNADVTPADHRFTVRAGRHC